MNRNKKIKRTIRNLSNPQKLIKRINILTQSEMESIDAFSSILSLIGGLDKSKGYSNENLYFNGLESDAVYRFVFEDQYGELKQYDSRGMVFQEKNFKKRRGSILERERLSPIQMFYSDGTSEYGFAFLNRKFPNGDCLKARLRSYYRRVGKIKENGTIKYGVSTDTPMWVLKYLPRFNEKMLDAFVKPVDTPIKIDQEKYREYGAICGAVGNLCRTSNDVGIRYSVPMESKINKKFAWAYPSLIGYLDNSNIWSEDNILFDENHITTKSIKDGDIDIYTYFKSIYVKDYSEVNVRGIIPMSSLYSIVKVDKWNDNETEIWNNLDQTLKGKF